MKQSDHRFVSRVHCLGLTLMLVLGPLSLAASPKKPAVSPDNPLTLLSQGNARFVKGKRLRANYKRERKALTAGQHPYAIVLSCSDSRVPPEIVFDQSLGKLFVVRVAGNVVDPATLGSIEYAAEHLHSKLLFVLGHESCGAVKATVDGGHFSPSIESIVERIKPAVAAAKKEHPNAKDILPFAVRENVELQIKSAVEQSAIIRELVKKRELQIAGGVYRLDSGKIDFLSKGFSASRD
jgi:carbonic anhydrase